MDVTLKKAGNFQPFSDRSHLAIMIGFAYVINYVGTSRNLSCGIKGVTKMDYVIEMLNIRKEIPGVVANDNITLQKAGSFQPFSDRSHLGIMIGFAYVINYVGTSRNLRCGIKGVTKMDYVIEMLNIRKEFPGVVANDNITLQLKHGEIHALLGE